jgi:hypothetical protein
VKRFIKNIDRSNFLERSSNIKIRNAIQIARKFLEQYNSPVVFKSASINNSVCSIVMDIGLIHEKIVKVEVDTTTGTILEYTQ